MRGHQPLDILNGGGQEGLFAHVPDSEHAGMAETVVFFGLHEGAFDRLFFLSVNASALLRFAQGSDVVQSILPGMSLHPPSRHTRTKARCPSRIGFAIARVLAFPSRVAVFQ